jgi:hypothetical protein
MIAIHTKFIPPTNTKGARIKAYTSTGFTATVPYSYELSHEKCHFEAVKELVKKHKLQWPIDKMCYGDSADKTGYVFCFVDSIVEA